MDKKLTAWNKASKDRAEKRRKLVRDLRKKNKTWAEIGLLLGVSHQRAQQIGSK